VVHVPYELVKHLLPPEERRKVRKKEPCRVCGNRNCTCLADEYQGQCRMTSLPLLRREVEFHPVRHWRFDFVFLDYPIAVEIDGGTFSGGRHTRGDGYEEDCRKLNEGEIASYMILRFTGRMVKSGEALEVTERALRACGWDNRLP
jgi:very-short-patch-repair endonuclease